MKEFFLDEKIGIPFKMFGWVHFLCIGLLILGLFLVFHYRKQLHDLKPKSKRKIKIIMAVIMFLNMCIYYGSYLYYGVYDWHVHLPLHFCFISGNLFMLAMVFNSKKLYKITYFFALMGPLPAVIWPDLKSSFDYFVFYQYFISHHLFIIFSMWVYCMDQPEMNIKDVIKAGVVANLIFLIMFIFNQIFGTNYVMSNSLPEQVLELYPFLTHINYPVIVLEITGIFVLAIGYIPIYFSKWNKKPNKGLQEPETLL